MRHSYNNLISSLYIPPRVRALPVDSRGYPVPWFVSWFKDGQPCAAGEGEPDFRYGSVEKVHYAIRKRICWVCGGKLGTYLAFTIGPMCCVNRVTAEPPTHLDCAQFSVKGCPFMVNPRMRRNEVAPEPMEKVPDATPGVMLPHNPGVVLIWVAKTFKPMNVENGMLFSLSDPVSYEWYCKGKPATRADVLGAMRIGFPFLVDMAKKEGRRAEEELRKQTIAALKYLPPGDERFDLLPVV